MEQALRKSSEGLLAIPRLGGHALTTAERHSIDLSFKIKGWGSDLDPTKRPGVPMDKAPGIGIEYLYPAIEQQVSRHKVNKSTEHGKLTPVFGNVCPPRGLSGIIRNFAYNFSEGRLSHWILLIAADRIDMVEEIFVDLAHRRVPNIPKEMGLTAELKYNRKGLVKKATLAGAGLLAFIVVSRMRKRRV
jgi:hypothetical protein